MSISDWSSEVCSSDLVYNVNSCPLRGGEEAGDLILNQGRGMGDVDQLVVGRHAFFLGIEATPGKAFQFKLIELEVAEGADDRVDLARHQRRRQRPVHVDQFDIIEGETMPCQHGAEQRLLDSRHREADPAALEVGEALDQPADPRAEARRVGKEGGSPGRSRWSPYI